MAVAGTIGQAFIEILPDVGGFASKLHSEVGGAVDKVAAANSGAFDKLASVGQKAFLGLTGVAVGFGAAAVKAALEGQESQAQLANAVKNSGANYEELEPKIDKLTQGFAKFGYENDQAEAALARLVGITGDTGKSLDLMSTAADLAAARHIDLTTAANLVGRAAEGNITPLKKMGIQVADTGTAAGNAEAAIKALNDRFGGAAQAQADTYAGKLKAFHAEVSNLTEKVGNALLPVLADAFGVLAGGVEFFEHNRAAAVALGIVVGGPLVVAMGAYLVQEARLAVAKGAEILANVASTASAAAAKMGILAIDTETGAAAMTTFGVASVAVTGGLALLAAKIIENINSSKQFAKGIEESASSPAGAIDALKAKQQDLLKEFDNRPHLGFVWLSDDAAHAKNKYDAVTKEINRLTKSMADEEKARGQEFTKINADMIGGIGDQAGALDGLASHYHVTDDVIQKVAASMKIDLTKATDDQTTALEAQITRLQETNPAALETRDALAKLGDVTADATQKSKDFKSALDLLIGGNIDAEKAVVNLYDRIDTLGQKLLENAGNMDYRTAKGREDISTIEDTVTAIRNHIEAMQHSGASADDLRRALDGDTKSFDDQLRKAGMTEGQIKALNAQYGLVPSSLNTVITADFSQVYQAAADAAAKIPFLQTLTTFNPKGNNGNLRVLGEGGYFPGGKPELAVVGDSREVMLPLDNPKRMAEILRQAGVGAAAGSTAPGPAVVAGGGTTTTITLAPGAVMVTVGGGGGGDPEGVKRAVRDGVTDALNDVRTRLMQAAPAG